LNEGEWAAASDEAKAMMAENRQEWKDLFDENSAQRQSLWEENHKERKDWRASFKKNEGSAPDPVTP